MDEDRQAFALILAAGSSTRMGREKAGLPWLNGLPLLLWMVKTLSSAGWRPLVVLGPAQLEFWVPSLPHGCAVLNPHPEHGKTTSLKAGISAVPRDAEHILVTAVDQPRPRAVYSRMFDAARSHHQTILVPDRDGHRGHPVVLPGHLRGELLETTEESTGLHGLLGRHKVARLPGFDPRVLQWDLNTPADHEEALRFFESLSETAVLE